MSYETFIFNLSNKIIYTKDGNPECESCSLEFPQPSMDNYELITDLSQLVMNAMIDASRFAPKSDNAPQVEENKEPTAGEIKAILFSAKDTRFITIWNKFKELAFKTGTVDGSTAITDLILNKITRDDATKLTCEYIAFFIAPSLFSNEGL